MEASAPLIRRNACIDRVAGNSRTTAGDARLRQCLRLRGNVAVSPSDQPGRRSWQTRWTQNPMIARLCGFESSAGKFNLSVERSALSLGDSVCKPTKMSKQFAGDIHKLLGSVPACTLYGCSSNQCDSVLLG